MTGLGGSDFGRTAVQELLLTCPSVQLALTAQLNSFKLTTQLGLGQRAGGGRSPFWSLSLSLNSGKAHADRVLTKNFGSLMPSRKLVIQGHRSGGKRQARQEGQPGA